MKEVRHLVKDEVRDKFKDLTKSDITEMNKIIENAIYKARAEKKKEKLSQQSKNI